MKLAAVFALLLSVGLFKAQDTNDSLIKVLNNAKTPDTVKIKLAGDISWNFLANDIEQSMVYARKELQLAQAAGIKKEIAQAYSDIGNIYNRKTVYDSALVYYNLALKLRQALNDKVKSAGIYSNIATVYMRQSKFKEALEINFKNLKIFETINDTLKQAIVLGNIGNLYYELEQNETAGRFYKKGIAMARLAKSRLTEGNILVMLGGLKFEEGVKQDKVVNRPALDSALYYFTNAGNLLAESNAIYNLAVVNNNLGRIYTELKQYDKAIAFYEKGLSYRQQLGDTYGVGLSNLNLGQVYLYKKNYAKSEGYFKNAITVFLEAKNYLNLKQAYGKTAELYEEKGDYISALKFHQLYAQYTDSVYNDANAEQLAEMQTKYDTEKKDLQLAKNKAELETKEEQAFIKNVIIASIICLLVLSFVAAYFFYRKKQVQQKAELDAQLAKQKEIRSKAIIEAEEKERIRIATDLHDGVGQLLSAAKLNLSSLESKIKIETPEQELAFKNALSLVDDSVKEVRAVSHNMMPNTLLKLGLASAVKEFITKIQGTPNLKINLEIVGLDKRLEQEKETVLYRVIQEVVSNIIKHARASELTLQMINYGEELSILIEDNGVGFDTSKINDFEGIGLKNIMSRIEFINGSVHFDSALNRGTTVIIDIAV